MNLSIRWILAILFSLSLLHHGYSKELKYHYNQHYNDTLKVKFSYKAERLIIGNLKKPIALIGVYNKIINTNDTIQDIYKSISYLNFPQVDTVNFRKHNYKGFKILNLNNNAYKNDKQFWEEYNLPWLENLIANKTTIYVLSNSNIDQLKYQFFSSYTMGPIFFKYFHYNNQLMRTGFGKEIEYLDDLIKKGTYKWNENLGAYQAIN